MARKRNRKLKLTKKTIAAPEKKSCGERVVVGLSGGVDSSVALLLLKKLGYEPVGVSLKFPVWANKCNACATTAGERGATRENACCTEASLAIAKRVCAKLGVKHVVVDARREFERGVIDYFVGEAKAGRTPSPCVYCNRRVKIAELMKYADEHGIRFVATGHYAKIKRDKKGGAVLARPKDAVKDQTYGLCLLPKAWLRRLVFPLGDYTKQEVYDEAIRAGFEFFSRVRQSQDLCFVSEKAFPDFLKQEVKPKRGPIIEFETGKTIGTHDGLCFYTVGQRRGLSFPFAHYVKEIDAKRNALVVTRNRKKLLEKRVLVSSFNWLTAAPIKKRSRVFAQIRHHQKEKPATVFPKKNGKEIEVVFDKAQEGITPGQVLALYKKGACLGGGVIKAAC